jgi:ribosome modulation factor
MTEQIKAPVVAGGGMAAIVPTDIEQTFRLSQALARGGDMVPKHFQNQPEAIMAAIMRGMEIGLAPMQALSNIAVINGRASLWGDALPALMQRAGHTIDMQIEGEGDEMKAVATLTRGDNGKVTTREFSVVDAKKANLWGKAGPWQTYPKRMLQMRARAWAVRDGASDALMGLQVAEEMQDAPMRDVTPQEPLEGRRNLAQQLMDPTPPEAQEAAPEPAQEADEVPEAEVVPNGGAAENARWLDPEDIMPVYTLAEVQEKIDRAESEAELAAVKDMVSKLAPQEVEAARARYKSKRELLRTPEATPDYEAEGRAAFAAGKQDIDCPYPSGEPQKLWLDGWFRAEEASRKEVAE